MGGVSLSGGVGNLVGRVRRRPHLRAHPERHGPHERRHRVPARRHGRHHHRRGRRGRAAQPEALTPMRAGGASSDRGHRPGSRGAAGRGRSAAPDGSPDVIRRNGARRSARRRTVPRTREPRRPALPSAAAASFYSFLQQGEYEKAWEVSLEPDWPARAGGLLHAGSHALRARRRDGPAEPDFVRRCADDIGSGREAERGPRWSGSPRPPETPEGRRRLRARRLAAVRRARERAHAGRVHDLPLGKGPRGGGDRRAGTRCSFRGPRPRAPPSTRSGSPTSPSSARSGRPENENALPARGLRRVP